MDLAGNEIHLAVQPAVEEERRSGLVTCYCKEKLIHFEADSKQRMFKHCQRKHGQILDYKNPQQVSRQVCHYCGLPFCHRDSKSEHQKSCQGYKQKVCRTQINRN